MKQMKMIFNQVSGGYTWHCMRRLIGTFSNRIQQTFVFALLGCLSLSIALCTAQDENYDDDNYGSNQNGNGNQDQDNYNAPNYGTEDGYSNNNNQNYPVNNQQNLDSDGTNNNAANNQGYPTQASNDEDDYQGDDQAAAASSFTPILVRKRRSASETDSVRNEAKMVDLNPASSEPKLRVKRHGKYYIGPVYTYVKTDKHANFKWGVSVAISK